MRFFRTPFLLPVLFPQLLWRMTQSEKAVYLTFDDGPVPGPTTFVLDTLKTFSAGATFFCIGDNVRKHPELFNRLIDEGHTVGNHTQNHLNAWKSDTRLYLDNVAAFEQTAKQVRAGFATTLFRPPYGRLRRGQIRQLAAYRVVMWDVLTYDYDRTLTPQACLAKTLRAVRNGSIIVFHDSHKAWPRLEYVLPRLTEHLVTQGFLLKPLPA
jgi:peptidoglycan/xylan/chitin deacetylase (PgdA/CDA1 family)